MMKTRLLVENKLNERYQEDVDVSNRRWRKNTLVIELILNDLRFSGAHDKWVDWLEKRLVAKGIHFNFHLGDLRRSNSFFVLSINARKVFTLRL